MSFPFFMYSKSENISREYLCLKEYLPPLPLCCVVQLCEQDRFPFISQRFFGRAKRTRNGTKRAFITYMLSLVCPFCTNSYFEQTKDSYYSCVEQTKAN